MEGLAAESRRRTSSAGRTATPRSSARDELILYTSAASEESQRAVRTVHEVLRQLESSQVKLTTSDLSRQCSMR
jgi:hypothetical protein